MSVFCAWVAETNRGRELREREKGGGGLEGKTSRGRAGAS